jgi:GT2 family glycosyltransferase
VSAPQRAPAHPVTTPAGSPVGVVVITRDRCASLLATLGRLAALPERPPVVVVDNGSRDGTVAAVRSRHPGVAVLGLPRNEGAVARNYGAAMLDTPYVAFSDDDSWWRPGALARAAALFAAHPRLGLLSAATLVGPEEVPDPMDELLAGSALGTAPDLPGPSVLGFLACASVARREAFLGVGGFHPVLHFGGEEMLLALDLTVAGWGVAHCPGIVAHHHPEGHARPGREARMRRNELLTAWLRRPWPPAGAATARLARDALAFDARGGDARRALASALARLPAALRHRRQIPGWLEHQIRTVSAPGAPTVSAPGVPTVSAG